MILDFSTGIFFNCHVFGDFMHTFFLLYIQLKTLTVKPEIPKHNLRQLYKNHCSNN